MVTKAKESCDGASGIYDAAQFNICCHEWADG